MCLWVSLLSLLVSLLLYTVTALWIMYRSTQAPFDAHCRHDDVATALIRGICKMQLAVRIDKRPGKSHMALDAKKTRLGVDLWFPDGRHGDRRKEFQQSHYIFHCVAEVLGCIPEDSTETPVFHRLII